jgi:Leucine-rich repeat (LRR) protein
LLSLLLATPAVAFWLWLVIVPAKVAILCPVGCECDTAGFSILCSSKSLTAVPLIHLTDVRALLLSGNNIKLLKNDSFVSMTELIFLDISKCELRTIELGAFKWLTNLTVLFMHENYISEILPGTFENLSSLKYFNLNSNTIKHLNSAMFSGLGSFNGLKKLTHLSMWYNEISEILPGTFGNMSSLEKLDLSFNKIKLLNIGVFSGLVNLTYVYLTANELQYLHQHTFFGLPNTERLILRRTIALQLPTDSRFINSHYLPEPNIASSNISSLSVETFANVSALEMLDLRYNHMKTVDINILRIFPKLSKLYLYGNPIQCDCQLQEVWRWCEDRNIQTVYSV